MPDRTYKLIELVGSSTESTDQAIRNAIQKAAESLKGLDWFEVKEVRGTIADGGVQYFQVTLRLGFRVMSSDEMAS